MSPCVVCVRAAANAWLRDGLGGVPCDRGYVVAEAWTEAHGLHRCITELPRRDGGAHTRDQSAAQGSDCASLGLRHGPRSQCARLLRHHRPRARPHTGPHVTRVHLLFTMCYAFLCASFTMCYTLLCAMFFVLRSECYTVSDIVPIII